MKATTTNPGEALKRKTILIKGMFGCQYYQDNANQMHDIWKFWHLVGWKWNAVQKFSEIKIKYISQVVVVAAAYHYLSVAASRF